MRPPHHWQSDAVPRAGDLSRSATTRRHGFKPGDAVTVDGVVSRAMAPSCIRAKALFGGDADGYREEQRAGIVVLRVVGGIFGALGALLLTVGVVLRRAHRR